MKKRIYLIPIALMVGFTIIFAGTPMVQAKTTQLTYSNFFPPTHSQSKLAEAWCKEVEKRTNGRVTINYFPGGTLTKSKQIYDGVVTGLSDIGFCLFAYTRGRFPVMEAVDLPMGYSSGKQATQVVNAVYKEFNPKELQDTKVMYLHAHGPGIFHTKGKAIKTMDDFKGMKIRGTGNGALVIKALGGSPVAMPMPELYQSLQKGVVEGGLYPIEVNDGWKMGEVINYVTMSYSIAYTSSFFVVMSKGKWNSISKKDQNTIEQINAEWIPKHGAAWDAADAAGIKATLNQGHQIIGLDKKESARWKKAVQPVISEYIKKMDGKGLPGKKIVDFTVNTLEKNK